MVLLEVVLIECNDTFLLDTLEVFDTFSACAEGTFAVSFSGAGQLVDEAVREFWWSFHLLR
jgi:hypothetical protein